jgi:hypothetical protein
MKHALRIAIVLFAGTAWACGDRPTDTDACIASGFGLSDYPDTSAYGDSAWQSIVLARTEGLPADSLVEAVFFFPAVGQDERVFVAGLGATITYEFRGMPALVVRIAVDDLRAFASGTDFSNVTHVEIGLAHEVAACL